MQKVEGSSPFIRFQESPANRGAFSFLGGVRSDDGWCGYHLQVPNQGLACTIR